MNSRKESESIDKRNAAVMALEARAKKCREALVELEEAVEVYLAVNSVESMNRLTAALRNGRAALGSA